MIASRRSLAPLGLAALALPALAASPARAQDRAPDRAAVDAFYTQLLSAGGPPDLAQRAERILAPTWQSIGDYVGPAKTRAQFVAQLQGFGKLIPNLKFAAQEVLAIGNRFVARSRATGTPTGPLFGAPVGKSFDIMAIDVHTVENGLITVSYHVEDWASAIRQLNAK